MDQFSGILLDVWREACRHIRITESTAKITGILEEHMPVGRVLVRRIDPPRCCVDTVAVGSTRKGVDIPDSRRECSSAEMEALLRWWREGQVMEARGAAALSQGLSLLAPEAWEEDVLAGPLGESGGVLGALVFAAIPGEVFSARDKGIMRVLLDPFSVALDNDHRLQEMAILREAAEADRQSLLARLGRRELGDTIIGAGSGLRSVMERVELVAQSDVPVLILGETGTGKELVARVIHRRSPRAAGPVIRVNCGAIPPELIDSHLFGHETGAFTGAQQARQGWFERADGGTLFLDEIGELPLAAQVRLLRVLQDGWMERVGGQDPIRVDVRIVAATHTDLAAMVEGGKFREDLWYRIAVFPILLPPLRERVADIPALARHLAERAATRFGLPVLMPTDEDIAFLASYPWPGNIRELATVVDRAAIIGNGKRLEIATALGAMRSSFPASPGRRATDAVNEAHAPFLPLDDAMRHHIEDALRLTKGRIEGPHGAAMLLKINPHTLRARMRKLGIGWGRFKER